MHVRRVCTLPPLWRIMVVQTFSSTSSKDPLFFEKWYQNLLTNSQRPRFQRSIRWYKMDRIMITLNGREMCWNAPISTKDESKKSKVKHQGNWPPQHRFNVDVRESEGKKTALQLGSFIKFLGVRVRGRNSPTKRGQTSTKTDPCWGHLRTKHPMCRAPFTGELFPIALISRTVGGIELKSVFFWFFLILGAGISQRKPTHPTPHQIQSIPPFLIRFFFEKNRHPPTKSTKSWVFVHVSGWTTWGFRTERLAPFRQCTKQRPFSSCTWEDGNGGSNFCPNFLGGKTKNTYFSTTVFF